MVIGDLVSIIVGVVVAAAAILWRVTAPKSLHAQLVKIRNDVAVLFSIAGVIAITMALLNTFAESFGRRVAIAALLGVIAAVVAVVNLVRYPIVKSKLGKQPEPPAPGAPTGETS